MVEPARQRATIAQMVILSVGFRLVVFALAGLLLTRDLWSAVALLRPVAWAGVWVGNRLQASMSSTRLARTIAGLLGVTGVSLIVRTL